jgi:hypothetical protein
MGRRRIKLSTRNVVVGDVLEVNGHAVESWHDILFASGLHDISSITVDTANVSATCITGGGDTSNFQILYLRNVPDGALGVDVAPFEISDEDCEGLSCTGLKVVEVTADITGLVVGDVILAVNDCSVAQLLQKKAVNLVKDMTSRTLIVYRPIKKLKLNVDEATIETEASDITSPPSPQAQAGAGAGA